MTQGEKDAVQGLLSAAIRVVRAPMTGVDPQSPMARAILGLAIQLAAARFITVAEPQRIARDLPSEAVDAETGCTPAD